MEELLRWMDDCNSWKDPLRESCRVNGVKTSTINLFTPLKISGLYKRLSKRYKPFNTVIKTIMARKIFAGLKIS